MDRKNKLVEVLLDGRVALWYEVGAALSAQCFQSIYDFSLYWSSVFHLILVVKAFEYFSWLLFFF